jgi:hypothetical protein
MGDKPVGIAVYRQEDMAGEAVYLAELAIHPTYWNHHLGSILVSYDFIRFLFPHARNVCLVTRTLNVPACRFCKQKGFKENAQVAADYMLNTSLFTGFELVFRVV